EDHRDGTPQCALREAREQARVLGFIPLYGEFVGDSEHEAIALERDRLRGLDPRLEVLFRDFAPGVVQDAVPRFFERQLHAIIRSGRRWGCCWGRRSYGVVVEKSTLTKALL